jgi:hypothetical protein
MVYALLRPLGQNSGFQALFSTATLCRPSVCFHCGINVQRVQHSTLPHPKHTPAYIDLPTRQTSNYGYWSFPTTIGGMSNRGYGSSQLRHQDLIHSISYVFRTTGQAEHTFAAVGLNESRSRPTKSS